MTRLPAAALFDLDGVLIDTEGLYTDIWSEIEHAHPTGIDNFAIKIKGSTLKRILTTYYPDSDEQAEIIAMLNEREEKMLYTLFEGVEAFLADLKRHNIPAAIVTSSNAPKMERLFGMISGLRDFFAAVITDKDVSRSKPDPRVLSHRSGTPWRGDRRLHSVRGLFLRPRVRPCGRRTCGSSCHDQQPREPRRQSRPYHRQLLWHRHRKAGRAAVMTL